MGSDAEMVARALARPSSYAKVRLGMQLHPKQAGVLDDLFSRRKSRLAFFCSNEVGKTSRVATAAVLYAAEIRKARIQVTSASDRQLKEQLSPSLKRQAYRFPRWEFLDRSIKIDGINQALFYSGRDEGTFQGFHEEADQADQIPQLIIVDESAAVKDEILGAAEDRCNPTWLLFMGSPLDPTGKFYQMSRELSGFYSQHRLSKLECTKDKVFAGGMRGWHEIDDVARTIAKNDGLDMETAREIVLSGDHRGLVKHPLTLSSVFGEFSLYVEYALLTLSEYEKCMDNPPKALGGERHAFCDFAGGRAKNVLAVRDGNRAWIEHKWVEPNEMTAVGEFIRLFKKLQREIGLKPEEIDGDGDGLGGPMVRRIQELGWNINDFHGGSGPRFIDSYADAWSEAFGECAARIKACDIILPRDGDFQSQILGRKIKPRSNGKMKLETKEEMRARNLPSPDEADALCCAVMPAIALKSHSIRTATDWAAQLENYNEGQDQDQLPGGYCP